MDKQLLISRRNNRFGCHINPSEHITVQEGLSMTPSQIARCTERGLAVSSQIVDSELFVDGDESNDMSVPLERIRGIDVAEVWEAQQDARKRLIKAHKQDIETYGE